MSRHLCPVGEVYPEIPFNQHSTTISFPGLRDPSALPNLRQHLDEELRHVLGAEAHARVAAAAAAEGMAQDQSAQDVLAGGTPPGKSPWLHWVSG